MQGSNLRRRPSSIGRTVPATLIAGLSLLLVAASGSAQGAAPQIPGQPPAVDDSTQALMQEYQEKQMQLMQLQNQAIEQNDGLQTRQEEITEMVNAAVVEINPEADAHITRLEEIQQEAQAAQQAQDMQALQGLMTEAQGLQAELQAAQAEALEQEELSSEIEAFQEDLVAAMMEIDPEAQDILDRLDELAAELTAGPPPGA